MALEKRKIYIKNKEAKIREKYGKTIKIINVTGYADCPDCGYDEAYRRGINPNCEACSGKGRIAQTEEHSEKVICFAITEEELRETEIGGLKVGDFRLVARYEAKPYFTKAMMSKMPFLIGDIEVLPFRIIPTILETHIKVYASRVTE